MAYRITPECIGCGLCCESCVVDAIPETAALPFVIDTERCIRCGECEKICPVHAVVWVADPAKEVAPRPH